MELKSKTIKDLCHEKWVKLDLLDILSAALRNQTGMAWILALKAGIDNLFKYNVNFKCLGKKKNEKTKQDKNKIRKRQKKKEKMNFFLLPITDAKILGKMSSVSHTFGLNNSFNSNMKIQMKSVEKFKKMKTKWNENLK